MQKRNFCTLRHLCFRWLTLSILLVSIAIIGVGCSSDDDTTPRPSTVTTTRDAKGVWFVAGSEQDRLYDVFEATGYAVASDRLWQAETFRRSAREGWLRYSAPLSWPRINSCVLPCIPTRNCKMVSLQWMQRRGT